MRIELIDGRPNGWKLQLTSDADWCSYMRIIIETVFATKEQATLAKRYLEETINKLIPDVSHYSKKKVRFYARQLTSSNKARARIEKHPGSYIVYAAGDRGN